MRKFIASVGTIFFCVLLGSATTAGARQSKTDASAPPSNGEHAEDIAPSAAIGGITKSVSMGRISKAERERRKEACEKQYEDCYDWCSRSNRKAEKQRFCYENTCNPKLVACLDEIPN